MHPSRLRCPGLQVAALCAVLVAARAVAAAPQVHSSLDACDGRKCYGWAWDEGRPGMRLAVLFYVDRRAEGEPDFTATADKPRADLQATRFAGTMFEGVLPLRFRDGKEHTIRACVRGADGGLAPLHGSPLKARTLKVRPLPRYTPRKSFRPIRRDAEIWYGAEATWAFPHDEAFSAFARFGEWPFLSEHVEVVDMHNNIVARATRQQLEALKAYIDRRGLKMAAEMAGLSQWMAVKGDRFGEESAAQEMEWSRLWLKPPSEGGVGGRYDYLLMDDPIYRGLFPNDRNEGHAIDHVANELADAIGVWRAHNPNVKPVLVCNFPNWAWKGGPAYFDMPAMAGRNGRGEYHALLVRTVEICRQRGTPLYALVLDHPADFLRKVADTNQPDAIRKVDFLARVLDVEKTARSMGLKFGLYFNTNIQDIEPDGVFTREERARAYYEDTMRFIDDCRARGGDADLWLTYSWMKMPPGALPETRPYTMTWNAAQITRRLRGIQ